MLTPDDSPTTVATTATGNRKRNPCKDAESDDDEEDFLLDEEENDVNSEDEFLCGDDSNGYTKTIATKANYQHCFYGYCC